MVKVLVVEDEKRLNKIICEALEDEGYSVDACFDGVQALEYARSADYDVMIMDIMMPRMSGLDAVRQMRREGNGAPVLFLTARDSIADLVEGLESGGDYYLVKDFVDAIVTGQEPDVNVYRAQHIVNRLQIEQRQTALIDKTCRLHAHVQQFHAAFLTDFVIQAFVFIVHFCQ